jgi:sugar/nucleoside kinase (ribokinase family)
MVICDENGQRTIFTDAGANTALSLTPDLAAAIEQADVLVMSTTLYLRNETRDLSLEILDIARATDTAVVVDAADATAIRDAGPMNVRRFLDQADIVVANDEEVAALTSDQPAGWLGSLPNMVITHRAGGASWWSNGTPVARKSAAPVDIVDTMGAGGAFLAGVIVVLSDSGEFIDINKSTKLRALELGVSVAATACSQEGPWPR